MMEHDPFGNLKDWTSVLHTLEELDSAGRLEECQKGMIRILRFQGNWRLREEVLKRVGKIAVPSEGLIRQIIAIVCDENTYYELRILASQALGQLTRDTYKRSRAGLFSGSEPELDQMRLLLKSHQPPIFSAALHKCMQIVSETSGAARL
jgi:hypothetical protein